MRSNRQPARRENEAAAQEMTELEGGVPPTDLEDWPSGPAKYPDDYKGEPIAGGPTDPDAPS